MNAEPIEVLNIYIYITFTVEPIFSPLDRDFLLD